MLSIDRAVRCTINGIVQYSVTEHFRGAESGHSPPVSGVFFFYDISPIKVGIFVLAIRLLENVIWTQL